MTKLNLIPSNASYTVVDGAETISVTLDGGASRYRRDVIGARSRASVLFELDKGTYTYLRAFYRSATVYGSTSFTLDMILDGGDLEEYTAYFIPGTLRLTEQKGSYYVVSVDLEVAPNTPDTSLDTAIVSVVGTYGNDSSTILELIEELVNTYAPAALG